MSSETAIQRAALTENDTSAPGRHANSARVSQRDRDIVLVRRIDWRFLLPSPLLKRVLYVGAGDTLIAEALRQFSATLTVLEPANVRHRGYAPEEPFDLLVIGRGSVGTVQQLLPVLKDSGWIYWEVRRRVGRPPFGHPRRLVGKLRALGLEEIDVHWQRPDFSRCLEIVPLAPPCALRLAFDKVHDSFRGRLKLLFGKTLLNAGLLPYTIPCFSIVAQKTRTHS